MSNFIKFNLCPILSQPKSTDKNFKNAKGSVESVEGKVWWSKKKILYGNKNKYEKYKNTDPKTVQGKLKNTAGLFMGNLKYLYYDFYICFVFRTWICSH